MILTFLKGIIHCLYPQLLSDPIVLLENSNWLPKDSFTNPLKEWRFDALFTVLQLDFHEPILPRAVIFEYSRVDL